MSKASRQNARNRADKAATRRTAKIVKWTVAVAVLGLLGYALSQVSGIAYTDKDIGVVDFSDLSSSAKRSALEEVNRARCSCGCGMTLAQCVATDSTCPIREQNIDKIRTVVRNRI